MSLLYDAMAARVAAATKFHVYAHVAAALPPDVRRDVITWCGVDWLWGTRCTIPFDSRCAAERARFVRCVDAVLNQHAP